MAELGQGLHKHRKNSCHIQDLKVSDLKHLRWISCSNACHGQLYVATSQTSIANNFYILATDKHTQGGVYPEVNQ